MAMVRDTRTGDSNQTYITVNRNQAVWKIATKDGQGSKGRSEVIHFAN
jgi:hypothetical protein